MAIWCLLHLDPTKGFVAELELRSKLSIDDLRKLYTEADFTGFDPGRLRTLGDFSLTDRFVASAFRKAISRNFKREFPLSDYEIERGYRPKRVKLDADHIREDLKPTFEMLETGESTKWVMQPGEWLTPEEWTRIEPDRYILVYTPARTCKKGGRRVK